MSTQDKLAEALRIALVLISEWHDEFPDSVGTNEDQMLRIAREALAEFDSQRQQAEAAQPAARVALTKQQRESIVARVQRHPFLTVDQIIDEVERCHGITAPATQAGSGEKS